MFDSKQTLTHRLADATDLLIDFATLGEYGLEPVGPTTETCQGARPRPLPISDRNTFSQVLFPNRHRGNQKQGFSKTPRDANPRLISSPTPSCSPRPGLARRRGLRGASGTLPARGVA